MARKYRTLVGLGRCTIALHGYSCNRRTKMVIAQQASTQRIFVVQAEGRRHAATAVTSMPPNELLALMAGYTLTIDLAETAEPDAYGQLVAGK